ncbi:MAG: cobalamin-binding protein [Deltaproteobacteria bacterium]|nr:MAG: cobalamin-binding protein [Deltaproteobacteria bacterium]
MAEMEKLREMIINGNGKGIADHVVKLVDRGQTPGSILNDALIPAMDIVGDLYQKGEYFLPELLISARAMQRALDVIKPKLAEQGVKNVGKVVIGTVQGDLHDLGKNLVNMTLEGAGFEVIDLGVDVPPDKFVAAIKEHDPMVVGMSALITTTMPAMKETIEAITSAGLRSKVKIMVGGAPITSEYAVEIGADYYGPDSTDGKNYARDVATGKV